MLSQLKPFYEYYETTEEKISDQIIKWTIENNISTNFFNLEDQHVNQFHNAIQEDYDNRWVAMKILAKQMDSKIVKIIDSYIGIVKIYNDFYDWWTDYGKFNLDFMTNMTVFRDVNKNSLAENLLGAIYTIEDQKREIEQLNEITNK